ncbi:uncharacterized protein METZ01_LOCUS221993 [marine metagenome]|uniref:Uncharacterized protein n=1 Tax=marine metagenome TaxID=408172 RepID=A0A382G2N6_9ZZZZ
MKKYIIEYVGGTKGDMLCRFLNNIESAQDHTGKSKPIPTQSQPWLKLVNPYDLTLERFEMEISLNQFKFMPAHPLWVTYNKDYRDLLKKYNYEIYSIKFKPEHYVTIALESIIKNMTKDSELRFRKTQFETDSIPFLNGKSQGQLFTNTELQLTDLINMLYFEDKVIPEWLKTVVSNSGIDIDGLDLWKYGAGYNRRNRRLQTMIESPSSQIYGKKAWLFRLFNEMTEGRTILNYEDLYLGGYPFPDLPDREEEWKGLVENSWCDYVGNDYRKFILPDDAIERPKPKAYGFKLTKTVMEYLEQWKNLD